MHVVFKCYNISGIATSMTGVTQVPVPTYFISMKISLLTNLYISLYKWY